MAEGLLFFFETVITWVSRKKEKKKSESLTSDTLSEEILYYNILLFWCFPTSKHWKLSSPSHFHQQESFIILSDNRKYGLPFLWKKKLAVQFWHKFVSPWRHQSTSRTSTAVRNKHKLEAEHNRTGSRGTDDQFVGKTYEVDRIRIMIW